MARIVQQNFIEEALSDRGIGLQLPINVDQGSLNFTTIKQIHTNLKNLILTMKGERVYNPEFGSDLYRLLFEPTVDEELFQDRVFQTITDAVQRFMPFVTINEVNIDFKPDDNLAFISINYSVNGFVTPEDLDLEVII